MTIVRTAEREIVIGLHPRGESDEAQRLRRAIATAAREIRNPVTVLAGVATAFGDPDLTEQQRDTLLSAALRQSKVLERLTDDLLTAATPPGAAAAPTSPCCCAGPTDQPGTAQTGRPDSV